jgi:hypothetical protein
MPRRNRRMINRSGAPSSQRRMRIIFFRLL